jgi:hypothetical protein
MSNSRVCRICKSTSKIAVEADVAQLVEQSIRNRQVIGSSPIVGSRTLLFGYHYKKNLLHALCFDEQLGLDEHQQSAQISARVS